MENMIDEALDKVVSALEGMKVTVAHYFIRYDN